MSCERQIPYAVMNWRILIEEDFFFVDHTRYLHDLETYRTPVFLRPKRFGKSLWASMLEHYYDVRFRGEFAKLFGKTDVGRNPTRLANSFLVHDPNWSHGRNVEVVIVEVGGNRGYNWVPVEA